MDKDNEIYVTSNGELYKKGVEQAIYPQTNYTTQRFYTKEEYERLQAENEKLKKTVLQKCPNCNEEYLSPIGSKLYEENAELKKENDILRQYRGSKQASYEEMQKCWQVSEQARRKLEKENNKLKTENEKLKKDIAIFKGIIDADKEENERLKSNKGRCAFKCLDNTFCPDADKKITELELSRDCYKVSYETAKKYREIAEKALEDIKGIVIQAEQKLHCVCDITEMLLDIDAKINSVIGAEE